MRIWSIHPKYLDSKRLVAVWRETLLAKAVLEGKTQGYKNHPQLIRFKQQKDSVLLINNYLIHIYNESVKRGYKFDKTKISDEISKDKIKLNYRQLKYEFEHLKKKLDYPEHLENIKIIEANPIFEVVKGDIEFWEKVNNKP